MTHVPPATTPSDLLERWLPAVLGELLPASAPEVDISVGILLEGDGGGEWQLDLREGRISIQAGSRETAAVTWIQSVENFAGMVRGERGGVVGRRTAEWLSRAGGSGGARSPFRPDAVTGAADRLGRLAAVDARISVRLTGGVNGDWSADLMLGPGAIPDTPDVALSLSEEDAEALAGGGFDALQAVMTGRITLDGDLALLMRIVQSS